MLQKLQKYLRENNVKLFIKYDGERNVKKYTIRLLFNDLVLNSLGYDTDLPCSLLRDIFKKNVFFESDEIIKFFNDIINTGIEDLKNKYGNDCVIAVLIEEGAGNIIYMLHIQTVRGTRHISGKNYVQLIKTMLQEEI